MPEPETTTSLIEKIVLMIGGGMVGIFGKRIWGWLTGKERAEVKHISTTSDVSLLEMTDKVAKDYIGMFREATAELKAAGEDIKQAKRNHAKAAALIQKMLMILKQMNHDGIEQIEKEAQEILNG